MGKVCGTLFYGGKGKSILLSEGSQVSPSRPCDKCSVGMKTTGWLEAVA
jgi:hypothetical protein